SYAGQGNVAAGTALGQTQVVHASGTPPSGGTTTPVSAPVTTGISTATTGGTSPAAAAPSLRIRVAHSRKKLPAHSVTVSVTALDAHGRAVKVNGKLSLKLVKGPAHGKLSLP